MSPQATNAFGPLLFSVVVPVYNVERILPGFRRLVQSIADQSISEWELVLVDDASTDGTAAILAEYARGDKRIRVHTHQSNMRMGLARSSGARIARGEYVVFCDYDDFLAPEALRCLTQAARAHQMPDLIQFRFRQCHEGDLERCLAKRHKTLKWWRRENRRYQGADVLRQHLLGRIHSSSWARAVRTGLLRQVEFEPGMPEDIPHSLRLCAQARSAVVSRRCLYFYIERPDSYLQGAEASKVFRNILNALNKQCLRTIERERIDKTLPWSCRYYRLTWILTLGHYLRSFRHTPEELMAWGRAADRAGFGLLALAFFLARSVNLMTMRGGWRLALYAHRSYRDYRALDRQ